MRQRTAALCDAGDQRETERQCLAGTCLATAKDVLAGQRVGDGGGLDLERRRDAVPGKHANDVRGQAKIAEGDLCLGDVEGGRVRAGISEGGQENLSTGAQARECPAATSVGHRCMPARTPVARPICGTPGQITAISVRINVFGRRPHSAPAVSRPISGRGPASLGRDRTIIKLTG
jgi:hypothetical protein